MSDGHLGDLISALLDGELTGPDADAATRHAAACAECRSELEAVRSVRAALRALPGVEPPPGFLDRVVHAVANQNVVQLPVRRRWAAANVAVSVAASVVLLVLGAGGSRPLSHAPTVAEVGRSHEAVMSVLDGSPRRAGVSPALGTRVAGERLLAPERLAAPFDAAPHLSGGYDLVAVLEGDLGVHLLYANGRRGLSVFQQAGRVKWDSLPADGERVELAGRRAWVGSTRSGEVVVMEGDELVQVVFGDGDADEVLEAAEDLPGARSLSVVQRVRRSCEGLLEDFSLFGAA